MAQKQLTKVKGCKKCGRRARKAHKASLIGNATSLYVRDKITAKEYFALTGQTSKV